MALIFELVFGASLLVVAASLVALLKGWIGERHLVIATAVLAFFATAGFVAYGVDAVESFTAGEPLLLAAAGTAAAAVAEAGLVGLARGLARLRDVERLNEEARERLSAAVAEDTAQQVAEFQRVVARERANASHELGEQERQLAEERRDVVARQVERARAELTDAVASVQERLERRLTAWAADLDRGQRELETQLAQLAQRQREAVEAHEARIAADTERLSGASEEQRVAILKLRSELQRLGTEFLEEGRSEIEVNAAERRRALHEVSERMRARERTLREQVEREEIDARARLAAGIAEAERRQLVALERALERAANRLSEAAERQFDSQIKESREKSAERLSRELERGIEQFVRQAEKDISDRIAELARTTADKLQRRIQDVARAAEAQHELAADRVRHLSNRLDETLAAADERVAALRAEGDRREGALERD